MRLLLAAVIVAAPIAWLAGELHAFRRWATRADAPPLVEAEPAAARGCPHPVDARTDTSTSGIWAFRCDLRKGGCGAEITRPMTAETIAHG